MAVKRVFGTVDGIPVILEQSSGDRWTVPVPFDQDGEYVVEIIAEDEAGNRAYAAKMLFVVNTALLCVHVKQPPFYAALLDPGFKVTVLPTGLHVRIDEKEICIQALPKGYSLEFIDTSCGMPGRR